MSKKLTSYQAKVAEQLDAGWRMRLGYANSWFAAGRTVVRLVDPDGKEQGSLQPATAKALEAVGYVVEPLPLVKLDRSYLDEAGSV